MARTDRPATIPPSASPAPRATRESSPKRAESQDAVLLSGPLYHLTGKAQRRQALAEARRVLRPGGRLLAMAVCRFASLLDGLYEGWLDDPGFRPIVDQDLLDGQHRNPDPAGRPEFFTTAYFHTPDGLAGEIEQAGFTGIGRLRGRGPGLAAAPGVGRSAAARADPVRSTFSGDTALAHRASASTSSPPPRPPCDGQPQVSYTYSHVDSRADAPRRRQEPALRGRGPPGARTRPRDHHQARASLPPWSSVWKTSSGSKEHLDMPSRVRRTAQRYPREPGRTRHRR